MKLCGIAVYKFWWEPDSTATAASYLAAQATPTLRLPAQVFANTPSDARMAAMASSRSSLHPGEVEL
jgi:hypothetical protein